MLKRTKIVATLGPSTDQAGVMEELILAGVNVVRLNFSHGNADDHRYRAGKVREISKKLAMPVAILGDLQGPKIRISCFKSESILLRAGDQFALDSSLGRHEGDQQQVGIDYKELPQDSKTGDILLLDDGRIQLKVLSVEGSRINCEVIIGGGLLNNKGINRQGGGLSAAALTAKDLQDIKTAAEIDMDYVAVSFPRSAADIKQARQLLEQAGSSAEIIAKIERAETVCSNAVLDDIILACEGVMVARGDLGVEIGDAELIGVQKHLIQRARELNRVVITATQMMETMIHNPMPTRAEVFDVANAILDGTDAVMLSAETAAGKFPVEVVKAMSSICQGAEKHQLSRPAATGITQQCAQIDETIARSAMYTANHLVGVKAIVCLTESGSTPRWMSRIRSGLPIFALTRNDRALRRMTLLRGVHPMLFDAIGIDASKVMFQVLVDIKSKGYLESGDLVIFTKGTEVGSTKGTNSMQVVQVP